MCWLAHCALLGSCAWKRTRGRKRNALRSAAEIGRRVASSNSATPIEINRIPVQFFRMQKLLKVSTILWILLGTALWLSAEPIASLRPSNYVNDFAGVLDAATQTRLNDLCHQVEQKAQAQLA